MQEGTREDMRTQLAGFHERVRELILSAVNTSLRVFLEDNGFAGNTGTLIMSAPTGHGVFGPGGHKAAAKEVRSPVVVTSPCRRH